MSLYLEDVLIMLVFLIVILMYGGISVATMRDPNQISQLPSSYFIGSWIRVTARIYKGDFDFVERSKAGEQKGSFLNFFFWKIHFWPI